MLQPSIQSTLIEDKKKEKKKQLQQLYCSQTLNNNMLVYKWKDVFFLLLIAIYIKNN